MECEDLIHHLFVMPEKSFSTRIYAPLTSSSILQQTKPLRIWLMGQIAEPSAVAPCHVFRSNMLAQVYKQIPRVFWKAFPWRRKKARRSRLVWNAAQCHPFKEIDGDKQWASRVRPLGVEVRGAAVALVSAFPGPSLQSSEMEPSWIITLCSGLSSYWEFLRWKMS